MIEEGSAAPAITLETSDGARIPLAERCGRPLVLYFYPKDDTSGCTAEALDFTRLAPDFAAAGTDVVGVSKDDAKKHARFIEKHALAVPLASDTDGALCEAFGTWVEKSMYGRKYMGIDRATFLIDGAGHVARVWRKVKVPGHAEAVLAATRALG